MLSDLEIAFLVIGCVAILLIIAYYMYHRSKSHNDTYQPIRANYNPDAFSTTFKPIEDEMGNPY